MAGILDNKTRILDVIVTKEGRRQMFDGQLRPEYASFTDGQAFYEYDAISGSSDATDRIMFESISKHEDSIVYEVDDNGLLLGYSPAANVTATGQNGAGIFQSDITSNTTQEFKIVTGTLFASLADTLMTGSIDNLKKLQLIGSIQGNSSKNYSFNVSDNFLKYKITNFKPFGENPSRRKRNINSIEPPFFDKRLNHLPNFKFLPPVTKAGDRYGSYNDMNQKEILSFSDLINDIGPLDNDPVQGNTVSIYQDMSIENVFVESLKDEIENQRDLTREKFSVLFNNTNKANNLVGQMFEITAGESGNDELQKLDIIDFGEFYVESDSNRAKKHVFFIGKIFIDDYNIPTFVNIFTIVFD